MRKRVFALSTFFLSLLSSQLFGVEIVGPEVRVGHDEIMVDTGISLDEKILSELKSGMEKEITFYIDLFRVWRGWPDEFILGKNSCKLSRGTQSRVNTSPHVSMGKPTSRRDSEVLHPWCPGP